MLSRQEKGTFVSAVFPLGENTYHSLIYKLFASNHLFCCCASICCRLFVGPIAGGYLCGTLGFEWAAAVLSFAGLFIVSFFIKVIHFNKCPVKHAWHITTNKSGLQSLLKWKHNCPSCTYYIRPKAFNFI